MIDETEPELTDDGIETSEPIIEDEPTSDPGDEAPPADEPTDPEDD